MTIPIQPKIYHIVHVDRLSSIVDDQYLWCDGKTIKPSSSGTTIGMNDIKQRRLKKLLNSHSDLYVGNCVPFYFCPRSVMLYIIAQANHPNLQYRDGQDFIIHLEADLYTSVEWANKNNCRWAFTLSNAGSEWFEDRSNLSCLHEINWEAVHTDKWSGNGVSALIKEGKQAEFLIENQFPWHLIKHIGVYTQPIQQQVMTTLPSNGHCPSVEIEKTWYY